MRYKLFGKVVENPTLGQKAFVWSVVVTMLGVATVMSPVLVPTHFVLRHMGRQGFVYGGKIQLDKDAFAPREDLEEEGTDV